MRATGRAACAAAARAAAAMACLALAAPRAGTAEAARLVPALGGPFAGGAPGARPAAEPHAESGAEPGAKLAPVPGAAPDAKAVPEPGAAPGAAPAAKTVPEPGAAPAAKTVPKPGAAPAAAPAGAAPAGAPAAGPPELPAEALPAGPAVWPAGLPAGGAADGIDVEADEVDLAPGRLVARGHVRLREGGHTLTADEITVELAAGTAVAVHARLSVEGAAGACRPLGEAARLTIRADGTAVLEHAVAWPCACGPAGALVRVTSPRITLAPSRAGGARAVLHGATLRLGPVPLFWVPYLSVPTDGRGSGVLLPDLAYGARDGLAVRAGAFVELGRRT
ncbi:MAG TPA: hypothetical protein VG389_27020, partial [Myxococcota bacterium]|nr:hypothetical protein [Myxococcota bacterium]